MSKDLTARQQDILDFIVATILERSIPPTIREISDHFGIVSTQGTMRHLDALQKKGHIIREHGARSIRIPPQVLEKYRHHEQQESEPVRMLPLVGEVAAGIPITAVQDIEERLPIREDWLRVNDQSFFLRVRGDSMAEGIQPGDLVLVEPGVQVNRGEIVVAMIDDEATVKRFLPEPDRVVLRSDNPSYADIVVARDFCVVGRVTALIRKYR